MGAQDFLGKTAELAVECGDLRRQVETLTAQLADRSNDHRLIEQKCGHTDLLLLDGMVGDTPVTFHFDRDDEGHNYSGVWIAGEFFEGDLLAHSVEAQAERLLSAWEIAQRVAHEDAKREAA